MDGEEVRGAARVATSAGDVSWKLKLPFLCARPGNVGVQIDAYRAMHMFHHPRCGTFTERFLGIPFENSSMENYSRVLERTSKRARIVEDRLAKLRAREQEILDDTQQRQRRRREREAARQRKVWLHHQSLKKREQRQREDAAAVVIQRCTRGMLARRERDVRLQQMMRERAARTLQRSSKSFLARKRGARWQLEKHKERQMAAATVLQRQTRKRLALTARQRHQKLEALESPRHALSTDTDNEPSVAPEVAETKASALSNTRTAPPELARYVSLDLLFSDDEDEGDDGEPSSPSQLSLLPAAAATSSPAQTTQLSPRQPHRPKRPVSIKRVGGGFRATSFTPTKPAVPMRMHPDHHQQQRVQPPARRFVASEQLTRAAKRPTQSPLALTSRRPSVPSSPSTGVSSGWRGIGGADEASVQRCRSHAGAPLASSAKDTDELVLEELVEAYARSHVDAAQVHKGETLDGDGHTKDACVTEEDDKTPHDTTA